MKRIFLAGLSAVAVLLGLAGAAVAQTIGVPQETKPAAKPQIVPSMIVVNARAATLQGKKLTLEGVAPAAIVFADRPVRAAGHARIVRLLEEWGTHAPDSFAKTPPNATISVLKKADGSLANMVVTLKAPQLEGDRLSFDVEVLGGTIAGADGPASMFLDIVHLPIRQGMAQRSAWYTSVR